jgi:hypothetical protein
LYSGSLQAQKSWYYSPDSRVFTLKPSIRGSEKDFHSANPLVSR